MRGRSSGKDPVEQIDKLFTKLERAIDSHPKLRRFVENPVLAEPFFTVSRLGYTVKILVRVAGSRKKPSEITGEGDSAEEAIDNLIDRLDTWAEVL